ncbi:hypothetical protein scyTo_0016628, partial [Scyliorhinus torazame]|nr:hypothetical protein [Scyliorhinus torazame]
MEIVGKFEYNKKDLIGHGAFAVVFKGRYTEKHDWQVAIKCIQKKNLAKSQTLLGKEIKILKELKHDNIVALYDFQYCNGGDLADYLHLKGTLSEDTIRLFLQQIAGAMKMLHSKGVIHRDLKPQNILLSCTGGRKSNPNNIRIKIADFGFARYLQTNMLAATLCGSPMYMAPEVIMSQHYDAKADLWSIGTIVYQCLTGKAPFQANSPQNLRLFYEKNKTLVPNIPRETSSHLRHLLQGLLLRNYKDRMEFSEFFHHPFLDISCSMKKSAPVPVPVYPSSASTSSCSSSSTSHLASPPVIELLGDTMTGRTAIGSLNDTSSSVLTSAGLGSQGRSSSPSASCSSSPSPSGLHSAPNLSDTHQCRQKIRKQYSEPMVTYLAHIQHSQPLQMPALQPCRQMRSSPKLSELIQRSPLPTIVGSPTKVHAPFEFPEVPSSQNLVTLLAHQGLTLASARNRTVPNLSPLQHQHLDLGLKPVDDLKGPFGRSLSTGKLSDLLLKAAFGGPMSEAVSNDSLNAEKPMDVTAPGTHGGYASSGVGVAYSSSPAPVVFTVGSPPSDTPPHSGRTRMFSVGSSSSMSSVGSSSGRVFQCSPAGPSAESSPALYEGPSSLRYMYPESIATNIEAMVTFEAPELPEETLMEQEHTEILKNLRFTLVFVHCVMEIASAKGNPFEMTCSSVTSACQLQESVVVDQISLLSKEW